MLSLANQGIRHFIFGVKGYTNYRDLYDYFESGYGFSARYNIKPRVHIKYQPNVEDLGSADSARINMDYYEVKTPVFAVQGDNIFDINVKDLIRFHRDKGALMTIVLREVNNVEGLGIADIDKNCRIRRFVEKPLPKDAPSNLANTGLYVVSPEVKKIFKEKGIKDIVEEKTPPRLRLRLHPIHDRNRPPSLRLHPQRQLVRRGHTQKLFGSHEKTAPRRLQHANRFRRTESATNSKSGFKAKATTPQRDDKKSFRK